ncbi:hypothetical protein LguiB_004308 [Lonicera macranthoides]
MDYTLCDPAFDQAQESNYHISQGWQCDFYFGYGLDVIEETALNEKSLIQVLRILITEADNEILELEEDLVILQSQLAWADKEWSELCSAALKEKIECLDVAIQSLKNESVHNEEEFEDCLQLPREPAERIHDILKALLGSYFQQKETQPPKLVQNSTLSTDKLATEHSKKERTLSSSNLEMNIESPQKISSIRMTTSVPILDSSIEPERRRTGIEDRVKKPETAVVKYSPPHHATGCNLVKRLSNIDPITIKETEVKVQCSTSIIVRPSLDLEGKGTKTSETVKPADTALDSRTNAVKEAIKASNSNSKQSKEPKVARSNNIATSNPSLKKYERRITRSGSARAQESILTGTEHCVTNLLLDLPNHRKESTTKPRSKKTRIQLPKQVHRAKVGDTTEDTNSDSPIKPVRLQKRMRHSNLEEELSLIFSSSSHKNASFSRSKNGTMKEEKKSRSDLFGTKDGKLSLVSVSQKKQKTHPSSNKELRGLDNSLASRTEEDGWIAECLAVDSALEPVKLLPCPNVVEYLTLVELRAIGKQQKVRGYYKLRKAELAKILGLEVHGRARSRGKRSGAGFLSLMPGGSKTETRSLTIENKDIMEVKALPRPKMLKA